jgi:hypothetical protein
MIECGCTVGVTACDGCANKSAAAAVAVSAIALMILFISSTP